MATESPKLLRLLVQAFRNVARTQTIGPGYRFEVMYNPESLSLRHETRFQQQQGLTTASAQARYSHSRPRILTMNLVIDDAGDGTGTYGRGAPTVVDRVEAFLRAAYRKHSDIHEPPYLKLLWGSGALRSGFDCRLQSVDVNYTSFERDGSPLRAELDVVFVEDIDPAKAAALERLSSPDLSHRVVVRSGDTLPALCRAIYGSSAHYLHVARVNDLDGFRTLTPGQELLFPPFSRKGR